MEILCEQVEDDYRRHSSVTSSAAFYESESDVASTSRFENLATESYEFASSENEALKLLGLPLNNIELVKRVNVKYSDTFKTVINSLLNDNLLKYHKEYSVYLNDENRERFLSPSGLVNSNLSENGKGMRSSWLKYFRMQRNYIKQQQAKQQLKMQQDQHQRRLSSFDLQQERRSSRHRVADVSKEVMTEKSKQLLQFRMDLKNTDAFDDKDPPGTINEHGRKAKGHTSEPDTRPPSGKIDATRQRSIKFVRPKTALHRPKSGKPVANKKRPVSAGPNAPITRATNTSTSPVTIRKTKKEFLSAYSLLNLASSARSTPVASTHQMSNRRFADIACTPNHEHHRQSTRQDVSRLTSMNFGSNTDDEVEYLSNVYKIRRYNLDDPNELQMAKKDLLKRYAFVGIQPRPPSKPRSHKENTYTNSTIRFALQAQLSSDALRLACIYNKKY